MNYLTGFLKYTKIFKKKYAIYVCYMVQKIFYSNLEFEINSNGDF